MTKRAASAVLAFAALMAASACERPADEVATRAVEPRPPALVGPAAALDLVEEPPGAMVLDVRTPEEVATGRLPGARSIPLDRLATTLDAGEFPATSDTPILVYCRTGRRSAQAAALLAERGYSRVYDLDGGITAWSEADLPIDR
jgi:rhodanese-related sulfurtransferase